jgi:hypothetical protein
MIDGASKIAELASDSGYFTYIISTRRITSGELLKYGTGLSSPETTTTKHGSKNCSDSALSE